MNNVFTDDAVALLKKLIATPSVSRDENAAAEVMVGAMRCSGVEFKRERNNVWTVAPTYDGNRPTILLNAHIDTVKPVPSWTREPFVPVVEGDCLFGLGSNDCGGGLVSLFETFRILSSRQQKYNLVYLASAEEEVSGKNGFELVRPLLPKIDVAIVGEPTGMQPATAEKGLMVLDVTAHGRSGHAARNEGVNAIYQGLDDLIWMRSYRFERVSRLLGPAQMNVTMINAGTQHNVVPDKCAMVVDVRTNELYTNEEILGIISSHLKSDVKARSTRLQPSHIDDGHPLVRRCRDIGMTPYGSPTLSDQALMPYPSLKLGPGESSRSHSADEFIRLSEIENAINIYTELLDGFAF
jgi:acetylornithine deacetylase